MFDLQTFLINELKKRGFGEYPYITINQITRDIAKFVKNRGGAFTPENVKEIRDRGITVIPTGDQVGLVLSIDGETIQINYGSENLKYLNLNQEGLQLEYFWFNPDNGLILGEYCDDLIIFKYYNPESVKFANGLIRKPVHSINDVIEIIADESNGIIQDSNFNCSIEEYGFSDVIDVAIDEFCNGEKKTR